MEQFSMFVNFGTICTIPTSAAPILQKEVGFLSQQKY